MQPLAFDQITVDEVLPDEWKEKNISVSVLRLDKIHPVISGNKWFKLKYWLQDAREKNKDAILTCGGAYSNHIVATAAAGPLLGFKTTGIIRGERPKEFSATLRQAEAFGMQLIFASREDFRNKKWQANSDDIYEIREGGYGPLGAKGASEILNCCEKEKYSHVCCAVGTTTMMAGLIEASPPKQEIIGIPVLNNPAAEAEMSALLSGQQQEKKYQIIHGYHFDGYAKKTADLIDFMNELYQASGIPTDFVYTGKLFYAVFNLLKKDFFPPGSRILVVHSGGLQGNSSLSKDLLIF